MKRIRQVTTYNDPAAVAAWGRAAAARASYLGASTARMLDLARLAPGDRALVVGTGTGEDALEAASRVGSSGEVVATDISAAMIAEATRSVSLALVANVRVLVMDAQRLEFESDTFDAVISRNTLMFIPDVMRALDEMRRVLRLGGRMAATTWASGRRNPRLCDPLRAARALGVKIPPNAHLMVALRFGTPRLLMSALRRARFSDPIVERWPVVARYETVSQAVQASMDHPGTHELLRRLSRDPEQRMARSLTRRWEKYLRPEGLDLPGEQLVAAGLRLA